MAGGLDELKVKRAIIDPMVKRWMPPKHVSEPDAALMDYVEDLAGYPEESLNIAFKEVRRSHDYPTWPPVSAFVKQCQQLGGSGEKGDEGEAKLAAWRREAIRITAEITGQQKFIDAGYWKDGLFQVAREEIEGRVFKDLKAGGEGDPQITQGDMTRWRERRQGWAKSPKETAA